MTDQVQRHVFMPNRGANLWFVLATMALVMGGIIAIGAPHNRTGGIVISIIVA